jgi:pimeloyl-ACP methyl ester carboxylesterase
MEVMGNRNRLIGDLHVEIRGCGPPILLIHGFGASSFTWSKIIPSLAADRTIISLDLKGFGRSRKPRDGGYTLPSQAAAVLNVINTLGLVDLTVIGHSMGGGIALLVAMELEEQRPRRLNRLILIDSIACPQPLPLFIKVLRLPILGPVVLRIVPATWQVRYVLGQAYFNPGKIERDFVEEYAVPLRCRGGRAALVATARAIIPPDAERLIARYKQIRSPVFLLWGSHDRIVPTSLAALLKAAIPGASYKVVPSCGHAPQEEEPGETLSRLSEFLRALPTNEQTAALGECRPTAFPENNSKARHG